MKNLEQQSHCYDVITHACMYPHQRFLTLKCLVLLHWFSVFFVCLLLFFAATVVHNRRVLFQWKMENGNGSLTTIDRINVTEIHYTVFKYTIKSSI